MNLYKIEFLVFGLDTDERFVVSQSIQQALKEFGTRMQEVDITCIGRIAENILVEK